MYRSFRWLIFLASVYHRPENNATDLKFTGLYRWFRGGRGEIFLILAQSGGVGKDKGGREFCRVIVFLYIDK